MVKQPDKIKAISVFKKTTFTPSFSENEVLAEKKYLADLFHRSAIQAQKYQKPARKGALTRVSVKIPKIDNQMITIIEFMRLSKMPKWKKMIDAAQNLLEVTSLPAPTAVGVQPALDPEFLKIRDEILGSQVNAALSKFTCDILFSNERKQMENEMREWRRRALAYSKTKRAQELQARYKQAWETKKRLLDIEYQNQSRNSTYKLRGGLRTFLIKSFGRSAEIFLKLSIIKILLKVAFQLPLFVAKMSTGAKLSKKKKRMFVRSFIVLLLIYKITLPIVLLVLSELLKTADLSIVTAIAQIFSKNVANYEFTSPDRAKLLFRGVLSYSFGRGVLNPLSENLKKWAFWFLPNEFRQIFEALEQATRIWHIFLMFPKIFHILVKYMCSWAVSPFIMSKEWIWCVWIPFVKLIWPTVEERSHILRSIKNTLEKVLGKRASRIIFWIDKWFAGLKNLLKLVDEWSENNLIYYMLAPQRGAFYRFVWVMFCIAHKLVDWIYKTHFLDSCGFYLWCLHKSGNLRFSSGYTHGTRGIIGKIGKGDTLDHTAVINIMALARRKEFMIWKRAINMNWSAKINEVRNIITGFARQSVVEKKILLFFIWVLEKVLLAPFALVKCLFKCPNYLPFPLAMMLPKEPEILLPKEPVIVLPEAPIIVLPKEPAVMLPIEPAIEQEMRNKKTGLAPELKKAFEEHKALVEKPQALEEQKNKAEQGTLNKKPKLTPELKKSSLDRKKEDGKRVIFSSSDEETILAREEEQSRAIFSKKKEQLQQAIAEMKKEAEQIALRNEEELNRLPEEVKRAYLAEEQERALAWEQETKAFEEQELTQQELLALEQEQKKINEKQIEEMNKSIDKLKRSISDKKEELEKKALLWDKE